MARVNIGAPEPSLEPPEEKVVAVCHRCGLEFGVYSRWWLDDRDKPICGECIKEIATDELSIGELAYLLGYTEAGDNL